MDLREWGTLNSETPNESGSKWPLALWIGFGLTILWALVVIWYAASPGKSGRSQFFEFWSSDPNLFGDALAGIFAPLAFLWLVVATFIQKDELRLQVKELSNTVTHLGDAAASHRESQLRESRKERQSEIKEKLEVIARRITDESENFIVTFGTPKNPSHYLFGRKDELTNFIDNSDFNGCLLFAANSFDRLGAHYEPSDIKIYCDPHLRSLLMDIAVQICDLKDEVAALGNITCNDKMDAIGINILDELIEEFTSLIEVRSAPRISR